MKNVLKPLAKYVLIPLRLKAVASAKMQLFIRKCLVRAKQHYFEMKTWVISGK